MSNKPNSVSLKFEYLGRSYKVVYYYGSQVIELFERRYRYKYFLFEEWYWKRIFMGHPAVIERFINFADEQKQIDQNWTEDEK